MTYAVFPRRVGRIILDGVVNPVGWTSAPSYKVCADRTCNDFHSKLNSTRYSLMKTGFKMLNWFFEVSFLGKTRHRYILKQIGKDFAKVVPLRPIDVHTIPEEIVLLLKSAIMSTS